VQPQPVAAHHDGVGAGLHGHLHILERLGVRETVDVGHLDGVADLEAVQADHYRVVRAAALLDAADDVHHQLGALLLGPAVLIVPPVPPRGQEVVDDVAASRVDIDAVETGFLRPLGRVGIFAGDGPDLWDRQRPDHVAVEVARLGDVDGRGADRRAVVGSRMVVEQRVLPGTVVLHLHERGAPMAVDHVHQDLHPGNVSVVVHPVAVVPPASLRIVDRRRLHRDDPHSATGKGVVEPEAVLVHRVEFGLVEGVHARSRLVDAVARLHLSDLPRFQQLRETVVTHRTAPSPYTGRLSCLSIR